MNEVINKIYNNLINVILKDIEKDYQEIVKSNYLKYLNEQYFEKYKDSNLDNLLEKLIKFETIKWEDKTKDMKLNLLIEDPALNNLSHIASRAFQYANNRKETESLIDEDIANALITEMKELLVKVAEFNTSLANWYFSESLVELNYACGKSDNTSLRMGR